MFTAETLRRGEKQKAESKPENAEGAEGAEGWLSQWGVAQDATKGMFTTETRRPGEDFKGKTRAHGGGGGHGGVGCRSGASAQDAPKRMFTTEHLDWGASLVGEETRPLRPIFSPSPWGTPSPLFPTIMSFVS